MSRKADVLIVTVTKVESRAVLDAFQQASAHNAKPPAHPSGFPFPRKRGARGPGDPAEAPRATREQPV